MRWLNLPNKGDLDCPVRPVKILLEGPASMRINSNIYQMLDVPSCTPGLALNNLLGFFFLHT